jgi:hypothetical protein
MDSHAKAKVALTFALYEGDRLVRRDTIAHDIVKVGRDPRSHLRVDDELASRMHAVIEAASPSDITLIDLGNEPRTLVNGQRVHKCKVVPGDQIQIGSTLIVIEAAEAAASSPAPASGPGLGPPMNEGCEAFAYSMVKSGPDVSADEIESHLTAIEVLILWDSNVLHASHLTPPRSFCAGEAPGGKAGCDFFMPGEVLGAARAPIVASDGASASLVILPRARGHVDIPGQGKVDFVELISTNRARPSTKARGAYEYELPANAKARMEFEGSALVFQIGAVNAAKRLPGGLFSTSEPVAFLYAGLSFLVHMGLVAAFAFFMPNMRGDDTEALDRDHILMMQKLLNAAADREEEERADQEASEAAPERKEGSTGHRADGEEGSMGSPHARDTGHKYGVQGPRDNPDPHLAKQAALQEAAQFGMIGLVATLRGGDPSAPTAVWGREESSGADDKSARGAVFGDAIGDSRGTGGLGLTGDGERGGDRGEGIGVGEIGGLGHGAGTGDTQGIGSDRGRLPGGRRARALRAREGTTTVNGHLPPEVIQRIVRLNFGRFRLCYENGMRTNPTLQGRVTVKFIIDRSGAVAMTADGGSDLPDQNVVQCVVRGFDNLSFPQPEGGVVTVVYPIMFNPGD